MEVKIGLCLRLEHCEEFFDRAIAAYDLEYSETPREYIKWARRNNIEYPNELEVLVTPAPNKNAVAPVQPKEKSLGPRERDTLLKIIIAIAVDKYGYNPSAAKSAGVTKIKHALERSGFNISDDTVRAKLQEAEKYLSPEYVDDM